MPKNPNEFSSIEIADPPTTARRITRKGKKNVPYNEDPEILKRLVRVAELMLKGTPSWRIAEELKCSIGTAKRDVARVRELWRIEATEKLDNLRGDALAQYQRVMNKAWTTIEKDPDRSAQLLSVILAAQEKIDKIGGLEKPREIKVEVDGSIEVRDMDKVREERWNQVINAISQVVTPEG